MSGERAVNEDQPEVAGGLPSERVATSKTLCDTAIQDVRSGVLSRRWGRIKENDPDHKVRQHRPGSDLHPAVENETRLSLTIPDLPPEVAEEDAQRYIIGVLDDLRKLGESIQINKPRWLIIARRYGLSFEEMAVVLGMSEAAVRRAHSRAKQSPDYTGGG